MRVVEKKNSEKKEAVNLENRKEKKIFLKLKETGKN